MLATYKESVRPVFDHRKDTYRMAYDQDSSWPVSTALVLAVASLVEVEPTDMLPLARVVDPDALDYHVRSDADEAELSFEFSGYDVTVRGDGLIELASNDR